MSEEEKVVKALEYYRTTVSDAFLRKVLSDAINVINDKRRTVKYCKQACSGCNLTLEECRNFLYRHDDHLS